MKQNVRYTSMAKGTSIDLINEFTNDYKRVYFSDGTLIGEYDLNTKNGFVGNKKYTNLVWWARKINEVSGAPVL